MSERRSGWQTAATALAVVSAVIVLLGIVVIATFFAAIRDKSGDDLALNSVEHVASALADDLRGAHDLTDAETAAAEMFHSRSATVEPLTWVGAFGTTDGITIEARISAVVEASGGGAIFQPSTSAGAAERCYRYTVVEFREAEYEEIPCAGLPDPSVPPVSTRPELPVDAAERVEAALLASTGATALTEQLRQDFAGDEFEIEAIDTPAGERVVAVGVRPGTDCVLRVRLADGEIVVPSYEQIWLQPGEQGCSTDLYTAPPQ